MFSNEAGLRTTIAVSFCTAFVLLSLSYVFPRVYYWDLLPDFTMLWTGGQFAVGRASELYDVRAVTEAQGWIWSTKGSLPFIYPPSSLFLFVPFGLLPFWVAYWAWNALSAIAFWTAIRRVVSGWAIPLTFVSPHVVIVFILGQTTLWTGAALIWGLSLLRTKPFVAGICFGVAAALKPQSAFLAPVLFVSGRHWNAFAGAAAGFVACALPSLARPTLWLDWFRTLQDFDGMLAAYKLHAVGATPVMAAKALGFDGTLYVQAAGLVLAVVIIWRATKWDDLHLLILAFVFGTMLASPYAIRYELAVAAPVLVAAALRGSLYGLLTALPLFAMRVFVILPAILISLATAFREAEIRAGTDLKPDLKSI